MLRLKTAQYGFSYCQSVIFFLFCQLHRNCMHRAQHVSSETLYTALGTLSYSYRSIHHEYSQSLVLPCTSSVP